MNGMPRRRYESDDSNEDEGTPRTYSSQSPQRSTKSAQSSQSTQSASRRKERTKEVAPSTPRDSLDTLVTNTLGYILIRQRRMAPYQRTDIVKVAMKGQRNDFPEVLKIVKNILQKKFLLDLVGFEESKTQNWDYDSYLLISRIPPHVILVIDNEIPQPPGPVQAVLYVILTLIYMGGSPLDADKLWSGLCKLQLERKVCSDQEHFEKFLKNEYVSKQYLFLQEFTQCGNSQEKSTYEWGVRSTYEISKMVLLRRVAVRLGLADLKAFSYAFEDAKKQIEEFGTPSEHVEEVEDAADSDESEFRDLQDDMAALERLRTRAKKSQKSKPPRSQRRRNPIRDSSEESG